jgi:peptidoglycan/xylan/chitin deacetylase (PgdA/CDA1 family)
MKSLYVGEDVFAWQMRELYHPFFQWSRWTLKKNLGDLFGVTVRHFCYPYGKWSRRVRDLVEGAGYATAVTLDFGVNAEIRDPFPLRRIGVKHPSRSFRNLAALPPAGFPLWFFWQR